MTTTTIRLSAELKERVAEAAKRAGTTPHSFILEAIADKTAQEELRAGFEAQAEARYAKLMASGESIAWDEMKSYLELKLSNPEASLPESRKLAP